MKKSMRNYDKMNKKLEGVGFKPTDYPGKYTHSLFKSRVFDFTALSVEGVMVEIFNLGQKTGQENMRKNLKMIIFGSGNQY